MLDLVAGDFVFDLLELIGLLQVLELDVALLGFAHLPLLILLHLL